MAEHQLDEEAIFDLARRISSLELRAQYVDQVCGTNRELKDRIGELLMTHDKEQSFLERPPEDLAPTSASPIRENAGDSIGPYKLLQKIGEGGFGIVYMAEQTVPIKRKVALKIIKPGMDTKEVVARFEAERQALALMDHPNIAKVFDGGATNTGRPYFVMELVKGVPITEFCDSNKFSTRDRLKLFGLVCRAIQHAHQKGVIHRDLKPSNVMVTLHDNQPVPKVIDFGVAKAISQELTEKTMFTTYGQMIGTPQYMSPEQAQMSGLDIDTRSDVYSLGVLLYELLTGTTPLESSQLRNTAYAELQRLICEVEPPKPSTKVSGLGEQSIQIASDRGVDARKLNLLLRGDLDWIVMKALDKNRNRRFESAGSFAADIERYLTDQPILARPPSTLYQLRKFGYRNRNKVIVAITGVALLVCAGLSYWSALRKDAQHAREIGKVVTERENLDEQVREITQRHAIDGALQAIQNADLGELENSIELAEAAGAEGMLMLILQGRLRLAQGESRKAEELFKRAIEADPGNSVSPWANLALAYAYDHQIDKTLALVGTLDEYDALTFYDWLFKAEAQQAGNWGDYSEAIESINESIKVKKNCTAAYVVQAKLSVRQATVTGDARLIEQALDIINGLNSYFIDDAAAIAHLRFFTHVEAAHVFRFINEHEPADEHYLAAKQLLKENGFLSELSRADISYIMFLEYERMNDSEKDKDIFDYWKRLVFEKDAVGGIAGMYGMCAILQGQAELEKAIDKLSKIKEPSPDLMCQVGLMFLHAGQPSRAREIYKDLNQEETESALTRQNAQWIALLLGDPESLASVEQCCDDLAEKYEDRMSPWEKLEWDILCGNVTDSHEVIERVGADRGMFSDGMVTLALKQLSQGKRDIAEELLNEVVERNAPYFALYTAKAILKEWEHNRNWPNRVADTDVPVQEIGKPDRKSETSQEIGY